VDVQAWDLRTGNHLTLEDEIEPRLLHFRLLVFTVAMFARPLLLSVAKVFMRFHFHFFQDYVQLELISWTGPEARDFLF